MASKQLSLFPPPKAPAKPRPRRRAPSRVLPTELGRGPGDVADPDALAKLADPKTYLKRTAGEPMEGERC